MKCYAFEPEPGQIGLGPDELRAIGEITRPVSGATFDAVGRIVAALKARRLAMGLSLGDVSHRSGMTRQALSKIELGRNRNPTVETLSRYALALNAVVSMEIKEIDPCDLSPAS